MSELDKNRQWFKDKRAEQDAYWRGYAKAQTEILAVMRKYPQTYIQFISRGCTASSVPSYEEAMAKLKAKYVVAEAYNGQPVTDKLLAEVDANIRAMLGPEVAVPKFFEAADEDD